MGYGTARRKPVPAGMPRLFRRSRTCGASHDAAGKFPADSLLFTGKRGARRPVGWVEPSGLAFGKPKDRLRETHPTFLARTPHGEERRAATRLEHLVVRSARSARLEPWAACAALARRPSFETRPSAAPQDEVVRVGKRALKREFVAAAGALRHAQEQLVERDAPLDQALLLRVADQRLEVLAVPFGQSVFPRIAPQRLLLLLPGLAIPRERDDARVLHALHRNRLRLVEGHEHVDRDPRVFLHDLLLEAE